MYILQTVQRVDQKLLELPKMAHTIAVHSAMRAGLLSVTFYFLPSAFVTGASDSAALLQVRRWFG